MVHLVESTEGITSEQLKGFFVGWPDPPSPEMHLRILHGSAAIVLAVDDATQQVVGFVTAVSDGVLAAYIPLLEVLPAWQGQGIGTRLVERMLQRLAHLYMIDLLCDATVQPFYATLGMQPATGMFVRNYARQSGA